MDRHPLLNEEYALSEEQLQSYREKGHICLRQVAAPHEIAFYGKEIRQLVSELNYHQKPVSERDTYGKAFIQITNLWRKNERIKSYVMAHRFAKIAADLMGVDGVRIYHDQALFKEPGGGHTPWHQDQTYWPLDTDKTITMWMPLVPVSDELGSMTFASESHRLGYVNKLEISDESHQSLKSYIEAKAYETMTYGAMMPGDATFHSGWTMHSAPGNPSNQMREVMTIIYYADGALVVEPDSEARKNDLAYCFPGLKPGDRAATDMNPLVYSEFDTKNS